MNDNAYPWGQSRKVICSTDAVSTNICPERPEGKGKACKKRRRAIVPLVYNSEGVPNILSIKNFACRRDDYTDEGCKREKYGDYDELNILASSY